MIGVALTRHGEDRQAMGFSNMAVLVTGASRGIGRATAQAFLDAGARVAINGRTRVSVTTAIAGLGGGDRLIAAPGDVATVAGCEAVVGTALAGLGGLDVLVNNAGVFQIAKIADSNEPLWDSIMNINVKGTYFCSRAAQPALGAAGGVIVNVASEAGLNGAPGMTVYCASKGAVVNLTRAMALELAPIVRVNCVCPGTIDTDMARIGFGFDGEKSTNLYEAREFYPMKRIGTADEVAKAILYLASSDAGFVTGAALAIDGGATAGR
jgi:NAD(P)-dependent dehydrogenase (short-subunit alcohol dehydrogenase family)